MTDYVTVTDDAPLTRTGAIKLHDEAGFEGMRRAGRLAAEVLDMVVPHVVPGVETQALDDMIREHIVRAGAAPATLGYRATQATFPATHARACLRRADARDVSGTVAMIVTPWAHLSPAIWRDAADAAHEQIADDEVEKAPQQVDRRGRQPFSTWRGEGALEWPSHQAADGMGNGVGEKCAAEEVGGAVDDSAHETEGGDHARAPRECLIARRRAARAGRGRG